MTNKRPKPEDIVLARCFQQERPTQDTVRPLEFVPWRVHFRRGDGRSGSWAFGEQGMM